MSCAVYSKGTGIVLAEGGVPGFLGVIFVRSGAPGSAFGQEVPAFTGPTLKGTVATRNSIARDLVMRRLRRTYDTDSRSKASIQENQGPRAFRSWEGPGCMWRAVLLATATPTLWSAGAEASLNGAR
jgi:hypothetical protein